MALCLSVALCAKTITFTAKYPQAGTFEDPVNFEQTYGKDLYKYLEEGDNKLSPQQGSAIQYWYNDSIVDAWDFKGTGDHIKIEYRFVDADFDLFCDDEDEEEIIIE